MSRYLVTGAAGFMGSHLTEALLARGDDVVAVDLFTDYYDPSLKRENAHAFEVLCLDVAEDELPLDGVDGVFHLAAQPGVRASFEHLDVYLRRNVLATQRVLEQSEVRVVYASSSSVYGDAEAYPTPESAHPSPISPYGVTKLACEHLARASGSDAVGLRYFTVYGPRQRPDMAFARLVEAALEGREFELYGDASRSFTYVADAVAADDRRDGARDERRDLQRRRRRGGDDARGDRRARARERAPARRPCRARSPRRRQTNCSRRLADRSGARLGADDPARGRARGSVGLGRR